MCLPPLTTFIIQYFLIHRTSKKAFRGVSNNHNNNNSNFYLLKKQEPRLGTFHALSYLIFSAAPAEIRTIITVLVL